MASNKNIGARLCEPASFGCEVVPRNASSTNRTDRGARGSGSGGTGGCTGARLCQAGAAGARADAPLAGQRQAPMKQAARRREPAERATTSGWSFWATRCWGWWWPRRCSCSHPEWQEGELTRVRAQLVSRQHMAEVAAAIGLGNHLRLSRGEERERPAAQEHRALQYHGGGDRRAVSGRRPGAGAGLCPALVMGEAAEQLARGVALRRGAGQLQIGAAGAACRPRGPERPFTGSRARAAPTTASDFWLRSGSKPAEGEPGKPLARGMGSTKKHAEQDAARRALAAAEAQGRSRSRRVRRERKRRSTAAQ